MQCKLKPKLVSVTQPEIQHSTTAVAGQDAAEHLFWNPAYCQSAMLKLTRIKLTFFMTKKFPIHWCSAESYRSDLVKFDPFRRRQQFTQYLFCKANLQMKTTGMSTLVVYISKTHTNFVASISSPCHII